MENSAEPSSSISFTSSSHLSNGSMSDKAYASGGPEAGKDKGCVGKEGNPKYWMTNILPYGRIGYEAFLTFLSYLYTGKLRPSPVEVSTCVDNICAHDVCRPAIDFAVELMYASAIFQVSELVSLFQRRLLNLVGKAVVEDVIPIVVVAFHCQLSQLLTQCIHRVARSDLEAISIEKELPSKVAEEIRLLRLKSQAEQENKVAPLDSLHEKRVKGIHKALDSDDVELVRLLLTESDITLDEAYALHYAVAYCDPKIVTEVLSLGLSDVNLRNTRGNTVLHVAARLKEPSIIVSLLTKGASASEPTFEGQSALSICKRSTRPKEYQMKRENGQEANKDRMCIDILEREMRRNPIAGDASISSLAMADDLHMKFLYLEDRVAFARMFFPTEAKLAMEIAHAETTSVLAGLLSSRGSSGNLMEVDLNETPITQNKRLLSRIETLSRTVVCFDLMKSVLVELGRHYFPHCSQVLDKFMEDDLPDAFYLEKGTPEEQRMKRMRYMELKDEVNRAFNKDKAELHRSGFSSSYSASFKERTSYKVREEQLVEELKVDMKRGLKEVSNDYMRQLQMVDAIQRLGIAYHFKEEIDQALQNLFETFHDYSKENHDLYSTALSFRLLRQHGYRVSCEIFDKFKDARGEFKVPNIEEVKGVLEFYEATHLRVHGEDVLEHGFVFSRNYLESVLPTLTNPIAQQVHHALNHYSNRRGLPRLEARHYISIYAQYSSHHKGLLRLAKLDFNLLQSFHKKELSELYRWWKGIEVEKKLSYARDRMVETYFWILGVYFEPEYAVARKILTRVQALASLVDDTFDAYATFQELQIFTQAIERWNISCLDQLPDYMKIIYKELLEVYEEIEEEMKNKEQNIGSPMELKQCCEQRGLRLVLSQPHIVRAALVICRLTDDIVGHEFERKRDHVPSSIECYIEEHHVSKQDAVDEFKNRIEAAWKDINEAFLRPTKIPAPLLDRILNFSRVIEVMYSKGDWYTHVGPEMQSFINQLLIEPIPE
ncbi:UNVERIFIED_CONTAM: BTB/POZ domain and ankyrin repeat-containing protein NPR1 [Sesamum angustifolium]|uniref:BTB/POZ domain and ankyrin repeat-containing protein NPR1 n=1 Tax=Sesamum angustifolium TaxID=2727405 RepID=A0AAW2PD55_9LAMI